MVIISPAVDAADPLAAANGARAPRPAPAANRFGPAAAWSLFDVVHGPTATADGGAGTTPSWTTATSSGAYDASSSFPPPPSFQTHGDGLARYSGSIVDTLFLQPPVVPPPVHMQPPSMAELSYFYSPQVQGFPPSSASPSTIEPSTIRPELQSPTTIMQPASVPPSLYPQTQGTTAAPALAGADTQQAREDTGPAPRRRGRPSKRAAAVSEPLVSKSKPTKRVAVAGKNRAASSSQKTSSAATGSAAVSSAAHVPDQAAACTGTKGPMAQPDFSNGASTGGAEGHQQAANAPPELTTATEPQYADTSAVGVRFEPTDQELIGYLKRKYARQQMPVEFFKDFDVYQAHPMAIKGACGESQGGCWYAFSPRDRKYRNGERPARSVFAEGGGEQVGFWKSNSRLRDVRAGGKKGGAVIGRMTSLTFHLGRQPRGRQTGWKMKEYTIPENQRQPDGSAMLLNDWVVCKLFYKERAGRTNAESKADENAVSVEQSKEDKSATPAAAVGQEGGPGETGGERVQGEEEEDMQPQMVPADAHQASDYYGQDLSVDDYLVCDIAFAPQNDAANRTI